ncbi:MAG: hypothetical protein ACRC2T_04035, partial [Thermoguttaceae bacterium]
MKRIILTLGVMFMSILDPNELTFVFPAEVPPANYDESKVPVFAVPDPLVALDGTEITTAQLWFQKRRPELLKLFAENVYGKVPVEAMQNSGLSFRSSITEMDESALNGKATRIQMEFYLFPLDENQ